MRKHRLPDRHRAVEPGRVPEKVTGGRDAKKKPALEPGRSPDKHERQPRIR